MASKFTPDIRAGLLARIASGVSLTDACRAVGVSTRTFKNWQKKAKDGEEQYAEFMAEIDAAREAADDRPGPMDEDELLLEVSKAARKGSVQAMKLRWEMLCADRDPAGDEDEPADPLTELEDEVRDELAERRAG